MVEERASFNARAMSVEGEYEPPVNGRSAHTAKASHHTANNSVGEYVG